MENNVYKHIHSNFTDSDLGSKLGLFGHNYLNLYKYFGFKKIFLEL